MAALNLSTQLKHSGRFAEALEALAKSDTSPQSEAVRAELLERLGRYQESRLIAERLLKGNRVDKGDRSTCHIVIGRAHWAEGRVGPALEHFQRAVRIAQDSMDRERLFWARMRLFVAISEQSGPDAAASMLPPLRSAAVNTGDVTILATLHLFIAQAEAQRGLVRPALRHLDVARSLTNQSGNVWLNSFRENLETAIATLSGHLEDAAAHARQALRFAEQSGVMIGISTAHGNLANILFLTGNYVEATAHQIEASRALDPRSDRYAAGLDLLAQIAIAEGRLDDAEALLAEIDHHATSWQHSTYAHRYAMLTRVELSRRRDLFSEALSILESAILTSASKGDVLLRHLTALTKADLLVRLERMPEAIECLQLIAPTIPQQQPDVYARYQHVLASLLEIESSQHAVSHLRRGRRIFRVLGLVSSSAPSLQPHTPDESCSEATAPVTADAFESLASLLAYPSRTDLIGSELSALLLRTAAFTAVSVVVRSRVTESAKNDNSDNIPVTNLQRKLLLGNSNKDEVELHLTLKPGTVSLALFNALTVIVDALRKLSVAQEMFNDVRSIWPTDDDTSQCGKTILSGQLRDLMVIGRRIAKTDVTVLITGESGTGKEIIARAIHDASERSQKPFIPFNCTAVPQDLLESQLFGHRRGAFTGADRDFVGLIRAAREGTLFLDEIGELNVELQPKLLRFLESGEIAPLGEASPANVKVRIIAATNKNLDELVRSGRFREDLFYRLNVVPLTVKPLRERRDEIPGFVNAFVARAAEEFKKGKVIIADETMDRLLMYRWPGNVRQLQNEIRRMVALLSDADATLVPTMISDEILDALPVFRHSLPNKSRSAVSCGSQLGPTLAQVEREMIQAALRQTGGRVSEAARALGVSRKGLYLKRRRYGL